jgi:hypothetical protein
VNFIFFLHYKKKLPLFNIVINNCEPISISLESTFFFIKKKKESTFFPLGCIFVFVVWFIFCTLCGWIFFVFKIVVLTLDTWKILCIWLSLTRTTPLKLLAYKNCWSPYSWAEKDNKSSPRACISTIYY